jgi:L-threonylcarbamoyladenylate synthase
VAWLRVAGPTAPGAARLRASGLEVAREVSLSPGGDLAEAARRLFAALRELDASEVRCILAEPALVGTGLGHAIDDRLTRASAGSV